MGKTIIQLTKEKFQEIYTNPLLRNAVAFAHQHVQPNGALIHKKALFYPLEYIVTDEQIELAKQERKRAKKALIEAYKNKLVFICMGGDYDAKYPDDVCNYRIRTEFKNADGKLYFIEFTRGSDKNDLLHITYSIDRDLENELRAKGDHFSQPYYNFKNLQRNAPKLPYTTTNLLNIVNEYFNCRFTEIIIDHHTLSCDDLICESPKD